MYTGLIPFGEFSNSYKPSPEFADFQGLSTQSIPANSAPTFRTTFQPDSL